jgi:hypothetical protein
MSEPRHPSTPQDPGEKPADSRQITYRVGWKSGTIHLQDKKGQPPAGGTLSDYAAKPVRPRTFAPTTAATRRPALPLWEWGANLLFCPAPLPSAKVWKYVLAVVPIVAFTVLCWLAFALSRAM